MLEILNLFILSLFYPCPIYSLVFLIQFYLPLLYSTIVKSFTFIFYFEPMFYLSPRIISYFSIFSYSSISYILFSIVSYSPLYHILFAFLQSLIRLSIISYSLIYAILFAYFLFPMYLNSPIHHILSYLSILSYSHISYRTLFMSLSYLIQPPLTQPTLYYYTQLIYSHNGRGTLYPCQSSLYQMLPGL